MTRREPLSIAVLWAAGTLAVCGVKAPPRPPGPEAATEAMDDAGCPACGSGPTGASLQAPGGSRSADGGTP